MRGMNVCPGFLRCRVDIDLDIKIHPASAEDTVLHINVRSMRRARHVVSSSPLQGRSCRQSRPIAPSISATHGSSFRTFDTTMTDSPKGARSKAGCRTCRARKVRCDERLGGCANCERLGLPCVTTTATTRQTSPAAGSSSLAGNKRKRTYRSCSECRASKTRCSGDRPLCVRCGLKSLRCAYDDDGEPVWKQNLKLARPREASGDWTPTDRESFQHNGIVQANARLGDGETPEHEAHQSMARPETHWLHGKHLPEPHDIRDLVEQYFTNIHPLRCFGFLHKPSFMQRLDADRSSNRENDPLLLIVCALGAIFSAVAHFGLDNPAVTIAAGSQWAARAQQLVLARLDEITTENLMATVLIHDYELRMSRYGNAFMLSGLTARMAQALQINLEHSTDVLCQEREKDSPGASTKESRRRLMWCCYITDSFVGSGVDQLTLIKDEDIKIQLPCTERNFLLQNACVVETLQPRQFLRFLPPESLPDHPWDNMGIRAFYLRHIRIRREALKSVESPPCVR